MASTTILMITLFVTNNIGKSFWLLLPSLELDNIAGPAFDFFFSCQGRVYALTLLVSFLSDSSANSMQSGKRESSIMFRADAFPIKISTGGVRKSPPPSLYSHMVRHFQDAFSPGLNDHYDWTECRFLEQRTPSDPRNGQGARQCFFRPGSIHGIPFPLYFGSSHWLDFPNSRDHLDAPSIELRTLSHRVFALKCIITIRTCYLNGLSVLCITG